MKIWIAFANLDRCTHCQNCVYHQSHYARNYSEVENKQPHLCDAKLQWPRRSHALLACCLGAAFDRKLGDKLNRWLDKKLAVQNISQWIFGKITLP